MHDALVRVLLNSFGYFFAFPKQIDLKVTQEELWIAFDPSNALHSNEEFFQINLVAVGKLTSG